MYRQSLNFLLARVEINKKLRDCLYIFWDLFQDFSRQIFTLSLINDIVCMYTNRWGPDRFLRACSSPKPHKNINPNFSPFQKDPREKAIPPRPRGQRPEPENTGGPNNFFNFGGGGGNNGFQGRQSLLKINNGFYIILINLHRLLFQ